MRGEKPIKRVWRSAERKNTHKEREIRLGGIFWIKKKSNKKTRYIQIYQDTYVAIICSKLDVYLYFNITTYVKIIIIYTFLLYIELFLFWRRFQILGSSVPFTSSLFSWLKAWTRIFPNSVFELNYSSSLKFRA